MNCFDCHEPAIAVINGNPACVTHARILTPNSDIFDVCQSCGQTWNPSEGDMSCPNPDCDSYADPSLCRECGSPDLVLIPGSTLCHACYWEAHNA